MGVGHAAWARLWQIARKWSKRANLTQNDRILARYTAGASTQIDPDGDRCTPGLSCVQARALQCLHRDATTFILNILAWPNLIRNAAVNTGLPPAHSAAAVQAGLTTVTSAQFDLVDGAQPAKTRSACDAPTTEARRAQARMKRKEGRAQQQLDPPDL